MSTPKRQHRVALIGAGRIASTHLGFARGVKNASIVAVCDADPARAEQFAREKNVPAYFSDVGEMMRATEPSIVHVVTPPATHAALAIAAMQGGANVLIEKPMAMTVAECDRMIEVAREHGRRICVDHNRLFDPVIRRARSLVDGGTIGDIVSVEAHQGVNPVDLGATGNGKAHWSIADAFAPLWNLGPHPLYLVAAFLGPIRGIQVAGRRPAPGEALVGEIRVLLEGDGRFGFVAFSMRSQPYLNHVNLFGTKGTLRVNLNTMTVLVERNRKLPKLVAKLMQNFEPAAQLVTAAVGNAVAVATRRMKLYPGIGETIRRFYRSLDEGTAPPVDAQAGREVVALLAGIQGHLTAGNTPRPRAGIAEGGAAWTS
ncbi:MAG: Gfo/Idh/MocA family oxidoreductase [Thermodesulfobacteriota bacterium]